MRKPRKSRHYTVLRMGNKEMDILKCSKISINGIHIRMALNITSDEHLRSCFAFSLKGFM